MYRVLCNIPKSEDATSWYRAVGPIAQMRRSHRKIDFNIVNTYNWTTIQPSDVLFLQRPYTKDHVTICEMAKRARVPIWIDYDDYLLDVPTDNPTYFMYQDDGTQKCVPHLLHMADVVTVSTNALKQMYAKVWGDDKKFVVVPNAINERIYQQPEVLPKRQNLIVWRGSRTHHRDVMTVAQHLIETHNDPKNKDWVFCYLGDNLWFVTDYTPHNRTVVSKPLHVDEYLSELEIMKPAVMHVPLHDNEFNRCKSNIAWIEGTFAGAITIAPTWEEWQQPGVLNYESPAHYKMLLESVMRGDVDVAAENKKSWQAVLDKYSLSVTNKIRAKVIGDLLGVDPGILI